MKLNDILLNQDQLELLYKDLLVTTSLSLPHAETPASEPAQSAPTALPPLKGKFQKKFLWLVYEPEHPFLDEADFQFLSQVLEACRMNLDDIYLCNCFHSSLPLPGLLHELKPVTVIASGLPASWVTAATAYEPVQQQGTLVCKTEALSVIRADKTIKSKLWLSLKQILGL